jgi:hypothetical protein
MFIFIPIFAVLVIIAGLCINAEWEEAQDERGMGFIQRLSKEGLRIHKEYYPDHILTMYECRRLAIGTLKVNQEELILNALFEEAEERKYLQHLKEVHGHL